MVFAETGSLVNEILFSVAGESFTARDQQIYELVLKEVFQKEKLSEFTTKKSDDFLLSRLCFVEAKTFDLKGVDVAVTANTKKKLSDFSDTEISHEVEVVAKSLALIDIKEAQIKQKARFISWLELIKRKYQVKIKSVDLK